ncbi:phage major capsid protein [Lysobacter sp. CW239]|uniref:phage major capsid protein n=1 Tax=Lysobacteraceae TaxID=32033 RepID=UPI00068A8C23|nr:MULTISPECIES: phage major capsid protein [Lysobacter]QOD90164.1 phage major capsid protein [Lysobacter sp. CW239]
MTANINELVGEINTAFAEFKEHHTDELRAIRSEIEGVATGQAAREMGGATVGNRLAVSVGASVTKGIGENPAFAALKEWNQGTARLNIDAGIRAAMGNENFVPTDGTFYPSQPERRDGAVLKPQRPLRLMDVLPSRPVKTDSVEFVQLNATGDATEQIKEGDEKQGITFAGVKQSAIVATIAGHTTASRQVLDDVNTLKSQVDSVLSHKVLSRLEHQLINGAGGAGQINGLLTQASAFVPTIGTTEADIIGEALVAMANAGYAPGLVLMNPMDWFRIQLTRKNETDDEYVFGSPTVPVPPSLWNTRIVTTPSIAARSALVVDTAFTTVLDRQKVSVLVSNSHADYFTRNLIMILAEMRAGLEVLDVNAVRKLTLPAIVP